MDCSSGYESNSQYEESCYDVVLVGFGPASLSIAIALLEQSGETPKVLIIDRDFSFSWRGSELPMGRTRMRTNLMQDLVTARNPKSRFSFINYLWSTDNLVGFTNLSAINPPRVLFDMYLQWCAKQFDALGWTQYGREVVSVEPRHTASGSRAVSSFRIKTLDLVNKSSDYVFAEKVIIAPGMTKRLSTPLSDSTLLDKIFHASNLVRAESQIAQSTSRCLNIAIVGTNDEAVEVLDYCLALGRQVFVTLFADGTSVQQTDKNPFAGNAILASKSAAYEVVSKQHGHAQNTSSVQSDSLASLYSRYYAQHILPPTPGQSRFEVRQFHEITGAERCSDSNRISLKLHNTIDNSRTSTEGFDFVFAASGYGRGSHEGLIWPVREYFDDRNGNLSVDAGYRVNLNRRRVSPEAGIWVVDGYENGADDAFPFMALRADRVLKSILNAGKGANKQNARVPVRGNVEWATL